MKRCAVFCGAAVLLWSSTALAIRVEDVPNPRLDGSGWVSDNTDSIDPETEARINRMIDEVERDLGVEIAVVTVDRIDDAPTPKDFATALFNRWHIGKADRDNGLLILLVLSQRRLEMETGYGVEAALTDGWLATMQQRSMVPAFRAGNYGAGLEEGVRASIARLRTGPAPTGGSGASGHGPVAPDLAPGAARPGTLASLPWLPIGGGLGLLALAIAFSVWLYRKNRTCPTCKIRMAMLPEQEDDVHLSPGQRTEERIGSIDYQFYHCTQCAFSKLIVKTKWFSGYGRCGHCNYRTSSSHSRTITPATYDSSGLAEVTTRCANCGHQSTHTRTIPRLQRPSSSSSSSHRGGGGGGGGRGFGGGSSGGGGAGSSW